MSRAEHEQVGFRGRAFRREVARTTALDSTWNGPHLRLGAYHLWIDASGRLRVKGSAPTSDGDGAVVGSQA